MGSLVICSVENRTDPLKTFVSMTCPRSIPQCFENYLRGNAYPFVFNLEHMNGRSVARVLLHLNRCIEQLHVLGVAPLEKRLFEDTFPSSGRGTSIDGLDKHFILSAYMRCIINIKNTLMIYSKDVSFVFFYGIVGLAMYSSRIMRALAFTNAQKSKLNAAQFALKQ